MKSLTVPFSEITDVRMQKILEEDASYEEEQEKLPEEDRWAPGPDTRLVNEIYGRDAGKLFFVVGCGPSMAKASKYLADRRDGVRVIAINAAIREVPADYWFFLDGMSYVCHVDHPNAKAATRIGADRYWRHYDADTLVWRRAHHPEDLKKGYIVNHSASLIAAMHTAVWLGAVRIVTVGCENNWEYHKDRAEKDCRLGFLKVSKDQFLNIQKFTYHRIAESLKKWSGWWLPTWCSLADASGTGDCEAKLPLPRTTINRELELAERELKPKYGDLWRH